jgi:general secretion pathway protein A
MRLRRAGCEREVFTSDTVALIHEATLGSMRDIDRIATATLRDAAKKKRKLVERDLASRVLSLDSRSDG